MSRFLKLIKGSVKSTTMQVNGGFLGVLLMLLQSDALNGVISSNPEYVAIALGAQSIINIFLRLKTKKAIADR